MTLTFNPAFLATTPKAPETPAGILVYKPTKDGSSSAFEKCGDKYKAFRAQYIAQLDYLGEFAMRHADLLPEGEAETIVEAFREMKIRLFSPNDKVYFGKKEAMFGAGKNALTELIVQLEDETLPLAARLDQIVNLARDTRLCSEGASTQFMLAAKNLQLLHGGNQVPRLKEAMALQSIVEYLKQEDLGEGPGWHIHYVNAMNNALAEDLGLQLRTEKYADFSKEKISKEQIAACLKYTLARMTPLNMARLLADEALGKFIETMRRNFDEPTIADTIDSFEYLKFEDEIDAAMEPLKEPCGNVNIYDLIEALDDDSNGIRYHLVRDPSLLAQRILESEYLFPLAAMSGAPEIALIKEFHDGAKKIRIEHHDTTLFWADENDVRGPLRLKHLHHLTKQELGDAFKPALSCAILNSTPQELLQYLPAAWVTEADPAQLVEKIHGEFAAPFFEKHEQIFLQMDMDERRALANAIIDHGAPSDLNACGFDAATLFSTADIETGQGLNFFMMPLLRGDSASLAGMADLLMPGRADVQTSSIIAAALYDFLDGKTPLHRLLTGGHNLSAIVTFGEVIKQAIDLEYLSRNVLEEVLLGRDITSVPALSRCMHQNMRRQVDAYGVLLRSMQQNGLLDPATFFAILNAPTGSKSVPPLALGLVGRNAAAVKSLGEIAKIAYEEGALDNALIAEFLACDGLNGSTTLPAWEAADSTTRDAFADLLLDLDAIKRAKEGWNAPYISLPVPEPTPYLPDDLQGASLNSALEDLDRAAVFLTKKWSAGEMSAETLGQRLEQLQKKIRKTRVGLFLHPGDKPQVKERVFSRVIDKWTRLQEISANQPPVLSNSAAS